MLSQDVPLTSARSQYDMPKLELMLRVAYTEVKADRANS